MLHLPSSLTHSLPPISCHGSSLTKLNKASDVEAAMNLSSKQDREAFRKSGPCTGLPVSVSRCECVPGVPCSSAALFCHAALQAVTLMEGFRGLDRDVEGSAKQWKKWVESECPEKERLPQEWKKKSLIQKMIILRALRPDRMTYALR